MRQSGLASGRWAARAARRSTQAARSKTAGISAVALEFPTHQLRVLLSVHHVDVVELDVQVLVDGVQGPRECHVVLQLHSDLLPHQGLEERVEELGEGGAGGGSVAGGESGGPQAGKLGKGAHHSLARH